MATGCGLSAGRSGSFGPMVAARPIGSGIRNLALSSVPYFPSEGSLRPVGSSIIAPFPLAGEQGGEPLSLLGGQTGDKLNQRIVGRFVRGFRLPGATSGATNGRTRRKLRQVVTCDR